MVQRRGVTVLSQFYLVDGRNAASPCPQTREKRLRMEFRSGGWGAVRL